MLSLKLLITLSLQAESITSSMVDPVYTTLSILTTAPFMFLSRLIKLSILSNKLFLMQRRLMCANYDLCNGRVLLQVL